MNDDSKIPLLFFFIFLKIVFMYSFGTTPATNANADFLAFYSNIQFHVSQKAKIIFNNDFSRCVPCNYTVRNSNYANSTPKDVILSFTVKKLKQSVLFAKTLRTTGSKAACVILLDSEAIKNINKATSKILSDCGVQLVNYGSSPYLNTILEIFSYRHHIAKEFLYLNRFSIDRVIMSDLFDTLFQGDPFNIQLNEYQINFVDEGLTLSHPWNDGTRTWLKENGPVRDIWNNFYTFCAGYIGGPCNLMIELLFEYEKNTIYNGRLDDQGTFNYLFMTGELQKAGILVAPFRNNELVHHMYFSKFTTDYEMGFVTTIRNHSSFASLLHHTYAPRNFKFSVLKACPRDSKDLNDYVNGISDGDIEKFEKENGI